MHRNLDFYDDGGLLLKETIALSDIPDFVKVASRADQEDLSPEDYAVVLDTDNGRLPRFPRNDPGNTALSTHYLVQRAERGEVADEVTKVAAMNLAVACRMYSMSIPDSLMKLAGISHSDEVQDLSPVVDVRRIEKVASARSAMIGAALGGSGGLYGARKENSKGQILKQVFLGATGGAGIGAGGALAAKHGGGAAKKAVREALDELGDSVGRNAEYAAAKATRGARKGIFGVRGVKKTAAPYAHTAKAALHFNEDWRRLAPMERAKLAQSLVPDCDALGIELVKEAHIYAKGVGDVGRALASIEARALLRPDDEIYPMLKEAAISMTSEDMVGALWAADEANGLSQKWGTLIEDPVLSVLKIKEASSDERLTAGTTDQVLASELKLLSINRSDLVESKFGAAFCAQFCKNPTTVFKSLPDDTKKILARMASDGMNNIGPRDGAATFDKLAQDWSHGQSSKKLGIFGRMGFPRGSARAQMVKAPPGVKVPIKDDPSTSFKKLLKNPLPKFNPSSRPSPSTVKNIKKVSQALKPNTTPIGDIRPPKPAGGASPYNPQNLTGKSQGGVPVKAMVRAITRRSSRKV